MSLATKHRLIGLCVLAMITIAAFSVQMAVWRYTRFPHLQGIPFGMPLGQALVAGIAGICTWKQKPVGYFLVLLVCALQNIGTAMTQYSQSGPFGYSDILDLCLAGLPLIAAMLAAIALLLQHYHSPQAA
jgi:hypothetical protein